MRVLVFGVDGLAFRVLQPMMQAGYLPNFQALARDGVEAILESKYPPLTPPAWMSLVTGLKPAKHGTYDFWEYNEEGKDRLVSRRKGGKAIWNLLSEQGKKVIVVNVPQTYPPDPVNGIMVSGIPGSVQGNFTFPKAFREELLAHVPDYRIDGDFIGVRQGKVTPAQGSVRLIEKRIELMHYLLEEKDWDFAFITFCAADYLQHVLWEDIMRLEPQVMRYYHLLDEALGYARASLGADGTLFVVSDHGFQGARVKFAINEYLFRKKWLHSYRHVNRSGESIRMMGKQVLNQLGLLEQGRKLKARYSSYRTDKPLLKQTAYLTRQEQVEAGVSMASFSCMAGGFADLCISQPLSTDAMAQLRGELLELTDPTNGQKLVQALYGTEVFGQGPYQPQEEHLLLLPAEGYTFSPVLGRPLIWEREKHLFGTHQKDGVLYACGPTIKSGEKGTPVEIYDLVPTVLQVMGLPQPDDLDGHVMEELFITSQPARLTENRPDSVVNRKLKMLMNG
jgi:predicted AlkP superfamily phosphohydrolase/phosphomutase